MMASSMATQLRGAVRTQLGSVLLEVLNLSVVPASHAHLCRQGFNMLVAPDCSCCLQIAQRHQ